ncbi:MAG: hypothetical protein CGW95_13135 [Phenylobacterium zucineum]|nr:MAG: hypothetical protein CGW95_13135 [Phenylobacterium zucineum]
MTVSLGEQGEAEHDSVFDFLYHDSRRVGSFLSQFDANGLLTGLTQGEGVTKGAKRSKKFGVGAQAPILGGGNLEFEIGPGEAGSHSMERAYDPFWTNALTLLDFLTERKLIQTEISEAALGQFVLVRGRLMMLDLTMFKDAWVLSAVQQAVRAGDNTQAANPQGNNRHERRSQGRQQPARNPMPADADIALELMGILPHTVHATVSGVNGETTWAVLRNEFMVTPSSELVLTHGSGIPGEWAMLGILSGQPDIGETELQKHLAQVAQTVPAGLITSGVGLMMQLLSPLIRTALGRPATAFAVTPLIIFREVT